MMNEILNDVINLLEKVAFGYTHSNKSNDIGSYDAGEGTEENYSDEARGILPLLKEEMATLNALIAKVTGVRDEMLEVVDDFPAKVFQDNIRKWIAALDAAPQADAPGDGDDHELLICSGCGFPKNPQRCHCSDPIPAPIGIDPRKVRSELQWMIDKYHEAQKPRISNDGKTVSTLDVHTDIVLLRDRLLIAAGPQEPVTCDLCGASAVTIRRCAECAKLQEPRVPVRVVEHGIARMKAEANRFALTEPDITKRLMVWVRNFNGIIAPYRPAPKATKPDEEAHILIHKKLHKNLDELVADYITHTKGLPSKNTILDLMSWAHEQTINPSHRAPKAIEPVCETCDDHHYINIDKLDVPTSRCPDCAADAPEQPDIDPPYREVDRLEANKDATEPQSTRPIHEVVAEIGDSLSPEALKRLEPEPTSKERATGSPDEVLNQCIYTLESIAPNCEHTVAAREAYCAWLAAQAQADGGGEDV